jgi:hypothetical protein
MFSIPNYIKESGFDARNRKTVKICCPVIVTLYTRCRINRCRYNRVRLYMFQLKFPPCVHFMGVCRVGPRKAPIIL